MNVAFLLDLTLRGSLVLLAAALIDQLLGANMSARWRRVWWLLVPMAFLLPFPFAVLAPVLPINAPEVTHDSIGRPGTIINPFLQDLFSARLTPQTSIPFFAWVWSVGVLMGTLRLFTATNRVDKKWSAMRLCTDSRLLEELENAKATAGITAPIGLVVSDEISAPALLGWLRPRILLPPQFAACAPDELRAVLLHELAHFKLLDIPVNWLFCAVRVVHWFNPLAWLAVAQWDRFREEAADEQAIRWLAQPGGAAYGEILLKTLRECPLTRAPYGALAIGESVHHLKRRILMIHHYASKQNRGALGGLVVLLLGALMALSPMLAVADAASEDASKKAALDAMQSWLAKSDAGDYAGMWTDASQGFQKALTSDQWVAAGTNVRTPLGKLVSRKLETEMVQTSNGAGNLPKGTYAIAQFDASFANLKSAIETVTFQQESDGAWRAAGYYIKPQ